MELSHKIAPCAWFWLAWIQTTTLGCHGQLQTCDANRYKMAVWSMSTTLKDGWQCSVWRTLQAYAMERVVFGLACKVLIGGPMVRMKVKPDFEYNFLCWNKCFTIFAQVSALRFFPTNRWHWTSATTCAMPLQTTLDNLLAHRVSIKANVRLTCAKSTAARLWSQPNF